MVHKFEAKIDPLNFKRYKSRCSCGYHIGYFVSIKTAEEEHFKHRLNETMKRNRVALDLLAGDD